MSYRGLCPDGGTCHEKRACRVRGAVDDVRCARVKHSGPLSGVFAGNHWPDDVLDANGVARRVKSGDEFVFSSEFLRAKGEEYVELLRKHIDEIRGSIVNEIHLPNSDTKTITRDVVEVLAKDLRVGDWLLTKGSIEVVGGMPHPEDVGRITEVEHGIDYGLGVKIVVNGEAHAVPNGAWCKVARPREDTHNEDADSVVRSASWLGEGETMTSAGMRATVAGITVGKVKLNPSEPCSAQLVATTLPRDGGMVAAHNEVFWLTVHIPLTHEQHQELIETTRPAGWQHVSGQQQ